MIKKYGLPILLAEVAILAIFSILVFALGHQENYSNASFIIGYVFVYVNIGLGWLVLFLIDFFKKHEKSINESFLVYPANAVSFLVYLVIAFIFFLAKPAKTTAVLIIDFILLIVYAVYMVLVLFIIKGQQENNDHIRRKVNFIRVTQEELVGAADLLNGEEKELVMKLSEDVRYSDPMSDASLQGLEDQIYDLVGQIREAAEKQELEKIKELVEKATRLVKERNRKCKILK